ncbi:MAG: hypothetical protein NTW46_02620 [Candidatus Nealsonbacteria bacterium]|nr:hypothetical protein [Candidatus Nealsonbacteria bacterium]
MSTASASETDIYSRFSKRTVFPTFLTVPQWNDAIAAHYKEHKISGIPLDLRVPVRYDEETINGLLETSKWLFVFDPGFSIRKMHTIIARNHRRPHFSKTSTWWLEEEWAFEESAPAFYLISKPMFKDCSWDGQEQHLKRMGENFRRASMRIAVNAAITWTFIDHQRPPFGNSQHWGSDGADSLKKIFFDFYEFAFTSWPYYCFAHELGVCVKRIFDF